MSQNLKSPSRLDSAPALWEQPASRVRSLAVVLASVLVAALLLLLLALWPDSAGAPRSLDDVRLVGARGPSCLRLVIASDVSGSMSSFAAPRSAALTEIRRWSARNLRADDQLGVLDFAGNAVWESMPASVAGAPGSATGSLDQAGTLVGPALDLVGRLARSSCDTAIVFLSDAIMSDLPSDPKAARTALASHHVHDVFLLVPGMDMDVNQSWVNVYPQAPPIRFDGSDPDATGLAFGRIVSTLTRQHLQRS